ncbi:hypothetical protein BDZ89DRAFT_1117698 [Hymenopellis radicata]|nr:hypothetical protein BDZ89DRAFT_1117698 [Hymenopellis radicata]
MSNPEETLRQMHAMLDLFAPVGSRIPPGQPSLSPASPDGHIVLVTIENRDRAYENEAVHVWGTHGKVNQHSHALKYRFVYAKDPNSPVLEVPLHDGSVAIGRGYIESKRVAEQMLYRAGKDFPTFRPLIVRVGLVSGSLNGAWSPTDFVPAIVKSSLHSKMRCLPAYPGKFQRSSWVPLDVAASAMIDFLNATENVDTAHLAHPKIQPTVNIMHWMGTIIDLPVVPFSEWIGKLKLLASTSGIDYKDIPALKLIPFFEAEGRGTASPSLILGNDVSLRLSRSLRQAEAISMVDVASWMSYWTKIGFLPPSVAERVKQAVDSLERGMWRKTDSPPRGSNSQPSDATHSNAKSLTLYPIELGGRLNFKTASTRRRHGATWSSNKHHHIFVTSELQDSINTSRTWRYEAMVAQEMTRSRNMSVAVTESVFSFGLECGSALLEDQVHRCTRYSQCRRTPATLPTSITRSETRFLNFNGSQNRVDLALCVARARTDVAAATSLEYSRQRSDAKSRFRNRYITAPASSRGGGVDRGYPSEAKFAANLITYLRDVMNIRSTSVELMREPWT